jgi:hypothetical protein
VTSAIKAPQASLVATETGHRASYDGTGYGFILWPYSLLVLGLLCAVVYGIWVDPPPHAFGLALVAACLIAPMMALAIYLAQEFTGSVELTLTHITKATLFGKGSMNWQDIDSVSFAARSYAIALHTKSGRTMRLPRFDGCEADLERCLRRYLPEVEFS